VKSLLKLLFGLGALAASLALLNWRALGDALARTSAVHLLAMFAICLLSFLFLAVRWLAIIRDHTSAGPGRIITTYLYANLLNAITPANLGGDVYRFCALSKDAPLERPRILGALFKERIMGLLGFVLAFLVGWALWSWHGSTLPAAATATLHSAAAMLAGGLCAGALALWLVSVGRLPVPARLNALVGRWLEGLTAALAFRSRRGAAVLVLLSLGAVGSWAAAVVLYSNALGADLPWTVVVMITVLVELARWIPLSIQGVGVREGLFAALYAMCGAPSEIGFAVGAVSYLVCGLAMIAFGLLGLLPESGRAAR